MTAIALIWCGLITAYLGWRAIRRFFHNTFRSG